MKEQQRSDVILVGKFWEQYRSHCRQTVVALDVGSGRQLEPTTTWLVHRLAAAGYERLATMTRSYSTANIILLVQSC